MIDLAPMDNLNILWSKLVCANMQRWGVTCAYVSPGYRNVPLLFALEDLPSMTKVICVDERSAAYQALGHARAHGRPVLLVCTSGTAGANYLPALLEASQEQLPLIAITADRPFEMIYSGANQVIEQAGLFGGIVRRTISLPNPCEEFSPDVVLAHVDLLMHSALSPIRGPVHLNMPLREPLTPSANAAPISAGYQRSSQQAWAIKCTTTTQLQTTITRLITPGLLEVGRLLRNFQRPLLIVGRLAGDADHDKILSFVQQLGWPTFCDIGSSLKLRLGTDTLRDIAHPCMRQLIDEYQPDGILHLGRRLVSKHYDTYISAHRDLCYLVVSPLEDLQDVNHRARYHLTMREEDFIDEIRPEMAVQASADAPPPTQPQGRGAQHESSGLPSSPITLLKQKVGELHQHLAAQSHDLPLSLPWLAAALPSLLSGDDLLFLGNSSTIRAFDAWSHASKESGRVEANRGVSGIEGLISTSLGLARGSETAVTAVIGDIAAIHDLNGFLHISAANPHPLIAIIVNDKGGGIFRSLGTSATQKIAKYIETPHPFEFCQIAAMSGCAYHRCQEREQFIHAYRTMQQQRLSGVIEIVLDTEINRQCESILMSTNPRSKL